MQWRNVNGDMYLVNTYKKQDRGSIMHMEDGQEADSAKQDNNSDDRAYKVVHNSWYASSVAEPTYVPQQLTSVCVQQPVSSEDPYSSVPECSAASEVIVEIFASQSTGGLDIEAYKPNVGRPNIRQKFVGEQQVRQRSTKRAGQTPRLSHQSICPPCNTSQALDVTDLSTDNSLVHSVLERRPQTSTSLKLTYFRPGTASAAAPEMTASAPVAHSRIALGAKPRPKSATHDSLLNRSTYTHSGQTVTRTPTVTYISMTIPMVRHAPATKWKQSPITFPQNELHIQGHTLSYNEPLTPQSKKRVLTEADLLRVTTASREEIKNKPNEELLSLSCPFANHPLYRSALYSGTVRNLYVQFPENRNNIETSQFTQKKVQRFMRPTIASAGKISSYAKYMNCTDLVKNLPLEGDDYAHPDNNISLNVDYMVDAQLHLGADKAPLPAVASSEITRIQNEILAEQAKERNYYINKATPRATRPRSAPLPNSSDYTAILSAMRRPRSAIAEYLLEARAQEAMASSILPDIYSSLYRTADEDEQQQAEDYDTEVALYNSFPSLGAKPAFSPTLSPSNHIMTIRKEGTRRLKQRIGYTGEDCSFMDHFSGQRTRSRRKTRARSHSTTTRRNPFQLSGQRIEKTVAARRIPNAKVKRCNPDETNKYGHVIGSQIHITNSGSIQMVPYEELVTEQRYKQLIHEVAQPKQVRERIQRLTAQATSCDINIIAKSMGTEDWDKSFCSSHVIPPKIAISEEPKKAMSVQRLYSYKQGCFSIEGHQEVNCSVFPQSISATNCSQEHEKPLDSDAPTNDLLITPTAMLELPLQAGNKPPSPPKRCKQSHCSDHLEEMIDAEINVSSQAATMPCITNISALTQLTSKSLLSSKTGTFSQGYIRGKKQYYRSHAGEIPKSKARCTAIVYGGAPAASVPFGYLVSPHKTALLANIEMEERRAYESGQYLDPTGLARSVQLATNLKMRD